MVQSGAHIELFRGPQPNEHEKLFTVRGSAQQIQLASQLIRQKVDQMVSDSHVTKGENICLCYSYLHMRRPVFKILFCFSLVGWSWWSWWISGAAPWVSCSSIFCPFSFQYFVSLSVSSIFCVPSSMPFQGPGGPMGYAQPGGFPGHGPMPGGPAANPWAQYGYGGGFAHYGNPAVVSYLCFFVSVYLC